MTIDDKIPEMEYPIPCTHDTAFINGIQSFGSYHKVNKQFTLYTCLRCKSTFKENPNYEKDKDVKVWLMDASGHFKSYDFVRRVDNSTSKSNHVNFGPQ